MFKPVHRFTIAPDTPTTVQGISPFSVADLHVVHMMANLLCQVYMWKGLHLDPKRVEVFGRNRRSFNEWGGGLSGRPVCRVKWWRRKNRRVAWCTSLENIMWLWRRVLPISRENENRKWKWDAKEEDWKKNTSATRNVANVVNQGRIQGFHFLAEA